MVINLISKYGVMPKKYFPETFSCESSLRMNVALRSKLREYARILRVMIAEDKATNEAINSKIIEQMKEVYTIVGICIGIPGKTFNWEYFDKSRKFYTTGQVTPLHFYETQVKPFFNVEEKVSATIIRDHKYREFLMSSLCLILVMSDERSPND